MATAVGGLVDAIEDGETGLLVPQGDVAALREALDQVLTNAELRRRLGLAAREHASSLFAAAAAALSLIRTYEQNVERQ